MSFIWLYLKNGDVRSGVTADTYHIMATWWNDSDRFIRDCDRLLRVTFDW